MGPLGAANDVNFGVLIVPDPVVFVTEIVSVLVPSVMDTVHALPAFLSAPIWNFAGAVCPSVATLLQPDDAAAANAVAAGAPNSEAFSVAVTPRYRFSVYGVDAPNAGCPCC